MFYQNHSLVLHTVEIFCNLILRNHWTWKISHYLNWLRLILWYIGLGLEKYSNTLLDSYQFYYIFKWDLKNFKTKLLDLDWFYDVLDLDLRNTWTNLLHSDWFYYNQAGIPLEKYENLLQWSVKQLVIQSSLASSVSLGQTMCGVWETKCF